MHSLFVPTLLKIGQGAQSLLPLAYTIGKQKWITIPEWQGAGKEKLVEIKGKKTALVTDVISKNGLQQIYIDHELAFAGNYTISSKTDKSELATASMNYARAESNLETLTPAQLEELASQSSQHRVIHSETASLSYKLGNELNGTPFWRICVILALLFVLFEILLLKLN
jgi:sensor domain CHASE-containing protein